MSGRYSVTTGSLSDPLEGRLKILLIDDHALRGLADYSDSHANQADWFHIVYATGPEGLDDLSADIAKAGHNGDGVIGPPFDIYFTDFNLSEAPDVSHERHPANAPAAGFLIGIMLASDWPNVPQAIIPYSGEPAQYGATYALADKFAPAWLQLEKVDSYNKGKYPSLAPTGGDRGLIGAAVRPYRKSIRKAFRRGHADLTLESEVRLRSLMKEEWVDAKERLHFNTVSGKREVKIGSFFYDVTDFRSEAIRSDFLRKFLEALALTALERKALALSLSYWSPFFWKFANDRFQRLRKAAYDGATLRDEEFEELEYANGLVPPLHRITVSASPDEAHHIQRLAVLDLTRRLIEGYHLRHQIDRSGDQASVGFDEYAHRVRLHDLSETVDVILGDIDPADPVRVVAQRIHLEMSKRPEYLSTADDFWDLVDDFFPPNQHENAMMRLLQPFPSVSATRREFRLDKGNAFGKYLTDKLHLDLKPFLLDAAEAQLDADEKASLRRLALRDGSDESLWPSWLR